jgi:hypothetical protein
LKAAFTKSFTTIRDEIFALMKNVFRDSLNLIAQPKVNELVSEMAAKIMHTGAQELKQLFLSKIDELKTTDNWDKLAEILLEIGLIFPAVHISHNKYTVEEVEVVLRLFVANSIFCGKVMKDEEILNIVKEWSNIGYLNMTKH